MYTFYIYSKKHGKFKILIDKEDKERVMQYNWSISKSNNYFRVETRLPGKKLIRLHRFILNLTPKDGEIDHKNRNTLDNRKCNLRFATRLQNTRNIKFKRKNKTGYIGVYKQEKRFKACLSYKNKTVHIKGSFKTAKEAAIARDELVYKISGEFAILNFPELIKKAG